MECYPYLLTDKENSSHRTHPSSHSSTDPGRHATNHYTVMKGLLSFFFFLRKKINIERIKKYIV